MRIKFMGCILNFSDKNINIEIILTSIKTPLYAGDIPYPHRIVKFL